MSNQPLPDFLSDGSQSSAPELQPTPETAPAVEAQAEAAPAASGAIRDAQGRFAPAQASDAAPAAQAAPSEPAPVAETPPTQPPAQAQPQEHPFAPIAALLEEREKRQAAERRAKELEDWRAQQEAQARRQPVPDPTTDPQGFRQHQAQQLDQVFWDQRLEMSRGFAEVRHGAEMVEKAFDWGVQRCDQDPYFNAKVRSSKDPVGFVVAEFQRDQTLSHLTPDLVPLLTPENLAAFKAWQANYAGGVPPAPAALTAAPQPSAALAAPPAKPVAPRPSLAAAPSASTSSAPLAADGAETYRRMFG